MRTIKENIDELLEKSDSFNARAVSDLRRAWQQVAPEAVLDHTGSVIFDKKDPDIVVVYTEAAIYKAELEAEKEIYRILLTNALRPFPANPIREVRFAVNRETYQKKARNTTNQNAAETTVKPISLNAAEAEKVFRTVASMKDEKLKQSLFKAMVADMEWKKGREASKAP